MAGHNFVGNATNSGVETTNTHLEHWEAMQWHCRKEDKASTQNNNNNNNYSH